MSDKKKKILIVDDDEFLLDMYLLKFQSRGFDAEAVVSSGEVLEKLKNKELFDALIIDVVMPVMDGLELLEKIRQEKLAENSAIIILSNQGQQTDIDRAKKLGADGYIIKASSIPSEVVAQVKEILTKASKK